jgi:hypothetical protein
MNQSLSLYRRSMYDLLPLVPTACSTFDAFEADDRLTVSHHFVTDGLPTNRERTLLHLVRLRFRETARAAGFRGTILRTHRSLECRSALAETKCLHSF